MRIISEKRLKECWDIHKDTYGPLLAWRDHVRRADRSTPDDVQKDFGPDVILPDNRAVFKIKGNNFRLVVRINYSYKIIFIRFIGTHKKYDEINVMEI